MAVDRQAESGGPLRRGTQSLRIRASSTLFRLRSAGEIKARLTFPNSGSAQLPTVLAGHLRGAGLPGEGFAELLYFVNVDKQPQQLQVDAARGKAFELHPVHRAAAAADRRAAADAGFDRDSGRFTLPARTAVVFVLR